MRLKLFLLLSMIICIISIVYIIDLLREDFLFDRELSDETTITVWTTTPGLSITLEDLSIKEPVKVNVKQFRDFGSLLEMLELSKVNNELPDMVEVDTHYGIYEMMARFSPFSVDDMVENVEKFHPSIYDSFQENHQLYAYPLGTEIPLLYMSQSVISNGIDLHPYPFQKVDQLSLYKEIQDKINEKNLKKEFRFFHTGPNIPWYWEAHQATEGEDSILSFNEAWYKLAIDYKLIPILENHKAITQFANVEVGVLITSSKNLLTVQQLIGNDFEFEVRPFTKQVGDPILIGGSGLVLLTENPGIPKLIGYLDDQDVQLELLSKTGWLPTQTNQLQNESFIRRLPMSKYVSKLVDNEENFVGHSFKNKSREKWQEIIEQVQTIEIKNAGDD